MTPQIDLMNFCESDQSCRHALNEPFVRNGKKYATDARIAVEIDADGQPESPKEDERSRRYPDVFSVFDIYKSEWNSAVFIPFPEIETVDGKIECPDCSGKKKTGSQECDECKGNGTVECEYHFDHECPRCHGDGILGGASCKKCQATGQIAGPILQSVGDGKHIDVIYDLKIRGLPGPVTFFLVKRNDAVLFRFNGGRGIVMCRQKNYWE